MQQTRRCSVHRARFRRACQRRGSRAAGTTRRKSHRAYSVRQISPGDRRLLAEFALGCHAPPPERELVAVRDTYATCCSIA